MQTIELLAILGRGIQLKTNEWRLTEDLEMCDDRNAHLATEQPPIDDTNPSCLIGGAELNLFAGVELCRLHSQTLKAVVGAYGGRSPYLNMPDRPSESEIMSKRLHTLLTEQKPEILAWPRERASDKTNTYREIQNIFELAVERGYQSVGLVTVVVHYARTALMAQRHLMNPRFSHLALQCYVSEDILLRHDPERFESRIKAMHSSKAFMRTMFFEQRGTNALLAGNY